MSKFQVITLAIFIIAIIGGVASFALYRGSTTSNALPAVTIWGTFPAKDFNQHLYDVNLGRPDSLSVTYVEKSPETFSSDFTNALAIGTGPDVILIPLDAVAAESNKLVPIPFAALSQREFMDSYVKEGQKYISISGILAIPFTIDPLMMFWNIDLFNSAGLATYPRFWDEFTGTSLRPGLAQKITVKDAKGNIRRSALAMGDFGNIRNAREILGSLLLQLGNPVTVAQSDGVLSSTLAMSDSIPTASAIRFFSQFVNPSDPNYSWSKALPDDKTSFLSGTLATYFGLASELLDIRAKNPNLNFDVAPLPQTRTGGTKSGYGRMYGFSIVRASSNANAAYQTIALLVSPDHLATLSKNMYLPPVRNDLITAGSSDPYISIFNGAALVANAWLDVKPAVSKQILGSLVQAVTSGQKSPEQAVRDSSEVYDAALKQIGQ